MASVYFSSISRFLTASAASFRKTRLCSGLTSLQHLVHLPSGFLFFQHGSFYKSPFCRFFLLLFLIEQASLIGSFAASQFPGSIEAARASSFPASKAFLASCSFPACSCAVPGFPSKIYQMEMDAPWPAQSVFPGCSSSGRHSIFHAPKSTCSAQEGIQ